MFKYLFSPYRLLAALFIALLIAASSLLNGCTVSGTIDPDQGRISGSIESIWTGDDDD